MEEKTVLSIAGLDPTGGAGVLADIEAIRHAGAIPFAVITSITYQNSMGVFGRFDLEPEVLLRELQAAFEEHIPDSIKVGMLGNKKIILSLASFLKEYSEIPIVLDPVLKSSSGAVLLEEEAVEDLKELLLPLSSLITPNVFELSSLCGFDVKDFDDTKIACLYLTRIGVKSVLVTGLKREGEKQEAIDILYDGERFEIFSSPWIEDFRVRGTGCRMTSAIASYLALGDSLDVAVSKARQFLSGYIQRCIESGTGLLRFEENNSGSSFNWFSFSK